MTAGGTQHGSLRVAGAELLLGVAALIWGVAFVAQKWADQAGVGVAPITALRFGMGALALLPMAVIRLRRRGITRRELIGGAAAGLAMSAASMLQQAGVGATTAAAAGFITGLYVLFVPAIGLLFGLRSGWPVWVGACAAVAGLYLLSVHGLPEVNRGDLLVLACAVVWACHVLVVGWASPRSDAILISVVQFGLTALVGTAATAMQYGTDWRAALHGVDAAWPSVLYLGLGAVAVAFTLQVVGQAVAPASHAALLLSLESVFAAIAGALLLGESLGWVQWLGCGLMLAGIVVSQVVEPPKPADESAAPAG